MIRVFAVLAWLGTLSLGVGYLHAHEFSAAPALAGADHWPEGATPLELHPDHATLLFFAHPRCPCTRNSLSELLIVLQRMDAPLSASMVLMQPAVADAAWSGEGLIALLPEDTGIKIIRDAEGALAARFGARASGTVMVYGPDGDLRYKGGVTASRSHAGPGPGVDALRQALAGGALEGLVEQLVFGCPLTSVESSRSSSP